MAQLEVAEDGTYLVGDVPFGYALWGDRLVEVPAELDACVTAIRMVKQRMEYPAIAAAVQREHGVEMSRRQFGRRGKASPPRSQGVRRKAQESLTAEAAKKE